MIRTIVMRFDDKGDSACLDKDDNFFIEDSIRSLLNDLSAIKDTHNKVVDITEIGNLEKEEYNATTKLSELPDYRKEIIKSYLVNMVNKDIDVDHLIEVGEKSDLVNNFGEGFANIMTNADPLFDAVYLAIHDYVKENYGEGEIESPSYCLEDLAHYIAMALKGKA